MSRDDMEQLLNNVLLACQLCLGLWQFSRLTPVGALIQGAVGWLLRPLRLSPAYSALQPCEGRVFKRVNCFALQADIPSDRRGIVSPEVNTMNLHYLGSDFLLERKGENSNMLFIDRKMCYYITHTIWEELQNLEQVLRYGLEGPPLARAAVTRAVANRADADAGRAELDAEHAETEARTAQADAKCGESIARCAKTEAERAEAEAEAERAEAEAEAERAVAERAESMARCAKADAESAEAEAEAKRAVAERAESMARCAKAEAESAEAEAEAKRAVAERAESMARWAKAEAESAEAEAEAERAEAERMARCPKAEAESAEAEHAEAEVERAEAEAELAEAVAKRKEAVAKYENEHSILLRLGLTLVVRPTEAEDASLAEAKVETKVAHAAAKVVKAKAKAEAKAKHATAVATRAAAKAARAVEKAAAARARIPALIAAADEAARAADSAVEKAAATRAHIPALTAAADEAARAADSAVEKAAATRARIPALTAAADEAARAAGSAVEKAAAARARIPALTAAADEAARAADSVVEKAAAARARIPALTAAAAAARATASAAHSAADARLDTDTANTTLFVKGKREFWREVITGGVMTFKEVLDAIILYNQHVSVRLSNDWLLPVNLSVSEEKLLKIFNLVALFLQSKKANVHWLIPTSLSFISALLEFNTSLRVWLYTKINELFCNIMHFICDRLPRSWRRQVYSLGKWVENLAPSNDILVKVVRGKMCAIISEGAEVNKEGAILVPWLETESDFTPEFGVIERQFRCHPIDIIIRCSYVIEHELCEISAPTICVFYVKCKSIDDFRRIVTLVSCVADKCCGSLISYGPNNKVCLRRFEESVTSYVNNGLSPIYKLELENVVVAGKDASH